jgi:hypothetical protein
LEFYLIKYKDVNGNFVLECLKEGLKYYSKNNNSIALHVEFGDDLHVFNMCIGNSKGFDTVWILEVQKKVQAETNFTFDNNKEANMFKVIEKEIKQMKMLQNLGLMDDDKTDMENIKYEGANENMTTIENNLNKKTKEKRIKNIFTKAMTTHEFLTKKIEVKNNVERI